VIEVRKIHKSFNEVPVLKGIDLDVHDNETLVILGPSGQGKTVFIKTLVRLIEPDSGRIAYDGLDIVTLKPRELPEFRKQIAFVFQNSALFDFLNVEDNLSLFPEMHGSLPRKSVLKQAMDAIRFVGLDNEVMDKFPEELSGGMRKRVAIARAIIKKPRYIFYDEPTTGLDTTNAGMVSRLILMLKKEFAMTSVIVTHDIELMKAVADRVALLKDGLIIDSGDKDKMSGKKLQFLYEIKE
jgi:phospholipid/cholesterol/gamma-HCH transport system ATP-binding protein